MAGFSFWAHPDMLQLADTKSIALYLFIKSRYRNSTVYDYSNNKIAKLAGISNLLTKRLITNLTDANIATIRDGNITMRGTRKVLQSSYKRGWVKFTIRKKDTLKDITDLLYLLSIKEKSFQQEYVKRIKADIATTEKEKSGLSYKRIKKVLKMKEQYQGKAYQKIVFTTRNLSKFWNVSHSTVGRIIKSLENKGFITTKKVIDDLGLYSGPVFERLGFGHCFVSNGSLYIHRGTQIIINI